MEATLQSASLFVTVLHWAAIFLIIVGVTVGVTGAMLHDTGVVPYPPSGAYGRDYSIARTGTLQDTSQPGYLSSKGRDPHGTNTLMRDLSVATASFGGIFTNEKGMSPYIGTVSPDAVKLQVTGGARAIIFDIWPDPADPTIPVVAAMEDQSNRWWVNSGGLNKGVGRFSNWKMLTRNSVRAGTMFKAAIDTAFGTSSPSYTPPQASDPFFLILCLHGAMTPDYLNTLAADLRTALNGHGMSGTTRPGNGVANPLCSATVDKFFGQACVIVCPDIQPGFQSLPSVNTYAQFATAFAATDMINYTNVLELQPNTILFRTEAIPALSQDSVSPCDASANPSSLVPPSQAGFCVVQPNTGVSDTSNQNYTGGGMSNGRFEEAIKAGAQFVGINMFAQEQFDPTISSFFTPSHFGKFSFRLRQ